jgi:hypothetical protein
MDATGATFWRGHATTEESHRRLLKIPWPPPICSSIPRPDLHGHSLLDDGPAPICAANASSTPAPPPVCIMTSLLAWNHTGGGAELQRRKPENPIWFYFSIQGLMCKKVGPICSFNF